MMKRIAICVLGYLGILFTTCEMTFAQCRKYPVLDSLEFVTTLPSEYLIKSERDRICSQVLGIGTAAFPCLIEQIMDTTRTRIRVMDMFDYVVGDVALILMQEISFQDEEFPNFDIIDQLAQKFYKKSEVEYYPFFYVIYPDTFFLNSDKRNFRNRRKMYRIAKKWYARECSNLRCQEDEKL